MKPGMKNPSSPRLWRPGWLFFGAERAGRNAAAMYTLVESGRAHGLPVESYLRERVTALPGVTDPEIAAARRGHGDHLTAGLRDTKRKQAVALRMDEKFF